MTKSVDREVKDQRKQTEHMGLNQLSLTSRRKN